MTTLTLHCTWRTCRAPAAWTITAGHPGTGEYYSGSCCDEHRHHIERRANQASRHSPIQAEPIANPPPTEPEPQLALDI
ncbi:MAG: hypothetical protein ACRD0W_07965 [Acidimicrobiales bacterium]